MRNGRWVASRGMDGGGREKARLIRPGFIAIAMKPQR
jgi:hypothetical protein